MRKDFTDANKADKERRLEQQKQSKKALKKSKKETKTALDGHRLGWTTVDGKES